MCVCTRVYCTCVEVGTLRLTRFITAQTYAEATWRHMNIYKQIRNQTIHSAIFSSCSCLLSLDRDSFTYYICRPSQLYWILMDFAYSENTPSDSLHSRSPTVALTADPCNQVISAVSTLESAWERPACSHRTQVSFKGIGSCERSATCRNHVK